MRFIKSFFVLGLLSMGTFSHAADSGLFVEPGVTYQAMSSDINWPTPFSDSSGKVHGLGLMARLGFHINDVLFVAADGRFSRAKFEDSSNSLDSSADYYDLGPVIGVQMPFVGLRVWGEYIATSQLDPNESNNVDLKFTDGNGYRIGAGFHIFLVSLNLEYQKIKFGHTDIEKLGPLTLGTTDSVKYDGSGWVASVSFPIEL